MTYLIKHPVKSLFLALSLSVASVPAAFANAGSTGFIPLPEISPDQIAVDVQRQFDHQTGATVLIAPTFDPFEGDKSLAGTASLRTGVSSISIDGNRVIGGAYLDLSMIYTTGSDDPYDVRNFERAVYIAGEPVTRIKQDVKTLDCSENVREVVYDEGYHRGSSYGYLAGLYVLLPRYRGHRGFGRSGFSRYGLGHYGYEHYGRSDRSGRRGTRDTDRVHRRDRDDRVGTGRGSDRDDRRRRRPHVDDRDRVERPGRGDGRVARPGRSDRPNDRGDRRRGKKKDKIVPIYRPRPNLDRDTGRRVENQRGDRDALSENSRRGDRSTSRRDRRSDRGHVNTPAPRPQTSGASSARPSVATPRVSRPSTSRPEIARPTRPASRPVSKPRKERVKPVSRPSRPKRVGRATDKAFKKRSSSRVNRRVLNFYPTSNGYARTDVYTSYRCVREEKVTLHIPQNRLEAARFDGMTIVMIDQTGQDVPVYLPPNYVQGFLQASQGYAPSPTYQPQGRYTQPPTQGSVSSYPLQSAPSREVIQGYPQN